MDSGKVTAALKRHPLFATLLELRGNPKACVYTEPLWGIPFHLYSPFATLYMYALGVSDQQIGMILTIGMILQVASSLLGGIVTDKMGRRKCTLIFDLLSWSIPTFIWMLSRNFWWFLIAAIFNSLLQVTSNSWNCLMVEDCPPKYLVDIYTWCTVSGLLAVFFAPLAGVLVAKISLIPAMRIIYGFAFIVMTSKFIILYKFSTETQQGIRRMEETRGQKITSMLAGYKDVFSHVLRTPSTRMVLAIMTLLNITSMVKGSFFSLYVNKNLLVPEQYIAYFPMIRAAVMLTFIFTVQAVINRLPYKPVMVTGGLLYIIGTVFLVISPPKGYGTLLVYMLCEAFGFAILMPRRDSLLVLFVDPNERARIVGLISVIMLGISSPFGWIAGALSEIDRRLPFMLCIVLYVICSVLVMVSKPLANYDNSLKAD